MKRIYLFLAFWITVALCTAQPNRPHALPTLLPDSAFIYSTKGNIYGFYHYIYNKKALRTEEHYFVSDDEHWSEQTQRVYTYDTQGNVLSDLQQQKVNNKWENQFRNFYAYDKKQHKTLIHNQIWIDSLGRWYNAHRFHYTYNTQGWVDTFFREDDDSNYIARIFYSYTPDGLLSCEQWQYRNDTGWMDTFRATTTYDSNNHVLNYLEENFNHTHGGPPKLEWEPWLNYIYTYDSLGNKTSLLVRLWLCEEAEWINERHFLYVYDSLQRCTEEEYYVWSRGKNAGWVKNSLTTYSYNEQDLPTYTLKRTAYQGGWINNTATTCSYDNLGNLTAKKVETWDISNICWENNAMYNWTYHINGGLLSESFANWDPQKKDWQGVYRSTHVFNENDDEEMVNYEMYDSHKGWYPFENTLFVLYHNNEDTLGTFHTSKVRVCYRLLEDSLAEDGIHDVKNEQIRCYPNPTKDKVFVHTEGEEILHCQLFSTDGRLCMECYPLQSEVELSVAHLPQGIYIVRCLTKKRNWSQTITKQ